jgi:hypothetical protein
VIEINRPKPLEAPVTRITGSNEGIEQGWSAGEWIEVFIALGPFL